MINRLKVVGLVGWAACSVAIAFAPGCGSDDDDSSTSTDGGAQDGSVGTGGNDSGGGIGNGGDATTGTGTGTGAGDDSGGGGTTGSDSATSATSVILGVTVTGLAGKGLVLSDGESTAQTITISENGSFAFANSIAFGQMYNVTVTTPPSIPTQSCLVAMGSGTASATSTPAVTVTCTTASYAVGGAVTGLISAIDGGAAAVVDAGGLDAGDAGDAGDGGDAGDDASSAGGSTAGGGTDNAVLLQNGPNRLLLGANGPFAFPTKVLSDGTYDVTIVRQPLYPAQTCRITGAAATVVAGDVTTVMVNCTVNQYTVGGTATGLTGTLVLQDGNGNSSTVTANGAYAFAPVSSSQPYNVTVTTQPVGQLCSVANPAGTVGEQDVQNVNVSCVPTYLIGGNVTGLTTGSIVLEDNGGDDLPLAATMDGNVPFTFMTGVVGPYKVTVKTQPTTGLVCTVTNEKGTATTAVHNVTVSCL